MPVMRVAQVIGKLADGGVEAVVNNYYRHTDTNHIRFDFYIDDDSERPPSQEMLDRGARYFRIPSSRHMSRRVRVLTRMFKENGYTIIHSHMNTLNAPVLYAAWRAGVPVRISHNHSTGNTREWKRAVAKQLLRMTGSWFATSRMACGEAAGRWFFGDRLFDIGKVFVLPNAIDVDRYRFDPVSRQELRGGIGTADRFVVGHAGRFMPQKNHSYVLRVFKAVLARKPEAVLWLVGDGELKDQIQAQAELMGISASVLFLGARSDLAALYSAMDCFILPSLYEGLPLVGLEAQAAGLPCFFSENVSKEVALSDEARFISLGESPERWAELIAQGAPVSQEQRVAGAQRIRGTVFDLKISGRMLEDFYETQCRPAKEKECKEGK